MNPFRIFLPDGSHREFPFQPAVSDVAKSISPGLVKIAVAAKVNGVLCDLCDLLNQDDTVEILTDRTPEGLGVIRHSTAHLMAMAIQELFPGTQITIGPVVGDQFYYDVLPREGLKITSVDFPRIEEKMREISEKSIPISKKVLSREEAIAHFKALGENYKVEIIQSLEEGQDIKIYSMGLWSDLCRGPHVPNTNKLAAFKLMSVAGAYWKANKDNAQLTRIYGTAWAHQKDLDAYLYMLEEAKKRDHIVLGRNLNLFTIMGDIAPGAPFFLPNGAKLFSLLQNYMRVKWQKFGFQEILTPQVMNSQLWKASGHYDNYKDDMYLFKPSENEEYGIKPMSCPAHARLFMIGQKSYRDLPLRYAEFGICHRNELSGTLHGLTRVRRFTQDDGHIFCTLEQVHSELKKALEFVKEVYHEMGFSEIQYFLSTRPKQRLGEESLWDLAENALQSALQDSSLNFQINGGDGAFYGPKIDFKLKDAIGRIHQCATIQLDFQMPKRIGASYQTSQNVQDSPVMIHRAVFGTIERFMGVFIEHCAGHFPIGLAPIQCHIVSVSEGQADYANSVEIYLRERGVRVSSDNSSNKLGAKIRDAQLLKIPFMIVLGEKELTSKSLSIRCRDGSQLQPMDCAQFYSYIQQESGVFWGLDVNQHN